MNRTFDVAIVGAGFAGSILAWILSRSGMRVALIDAATHPRFAIGESSTPIADMILRRLSRVYGLSELHELATWGNWQKSFPELACGRKRGFSYYQHQSGQSFDESHLGRRSLLIAASPTDAVSDTHWYRPDVDQFLFQHAVSSGATDMSAHHVDAVRIRANEGPRFEIECTNPLGTQQLASDWLIDASGASAITARLTHSEELTASLLTCTQSTYAHYRNVGSWTAQLQREGHDTRVDPFDGDDAAQHHLLQHGWLWMLRFNNGVTSVGQTTPMSRSLESQNLRPQSLDAYPSLSSIMSQATVVAPESGPRTTKRLQHLVDPVPGERHLLLPTAALTLDPLHSTGIAHALAGVDRVATILLTESSDERDEATQRYRLAFHEETQLLDLLVSTAYSTMHDFDRFAAACCIFVAGAICCEERYQQGDVPTHLWNADDPLFVDFIRDSCHQLQSSSPNFGSNVRTGLAPWNQAGLMDPTSANRYAYTATKR